MSRYLAHPTLMYYYKEIKKAGALENAVDNFWNNCLPRYFTFELSYGIEQEQRPLPGISKQRADFTIRYIKNGDPKKVALFKDKRRGYETQPAAWKSALDQLTTYLRLVRTEQGGTQRLYGAVTIGTFVRFYTLDPYEQEMKDCIAQENPFEIEANEETIHQVLTQ